MISTTKQCSKGKFSNTAVTLAECLHAQLENKNQVSQFFLHPHSPRPNEIGPTNKVLGKDPPVEQLCSLKCS